MRWRGRRQKNKFLPKGKSEQRDVLAASMEDFLKKKQVEEMAPAPRFQKSSQSSHLWDKKRLEFKKNREDYKKYMGSKDWVEKKLWILEKRGNSCEVCHTIGEVRNPIQVHHNNYENVGSEGLEDLSVLCRDCHWLFHEQIPATSLVQRKEKDDCSVCSSSREKWRFKCYASTSGVKFNLCPKCQGIFRDKIT